MRVRHKLFNFLFWELVMTVEAKLDTLIAGQATMEAAIADLKTAIAAAPAADNTAVLAAIADLAAVVGTETAPAV